MARTSGTAPVAIGHPSPQTPEEHGNAPFPCARRRADPALSPAGCITAGPGGLLPGMTLVAAAATVPGAALVVPAPERRTRDGRLGLRAASTPSTPYLELDVARAVDRFGALARGLPGTAVHYAVKANPHPPCSRALARRRLPLRRGEPGRGPRLPRCRRRARRPRLLQPGQAARPTSSPRPPSACASSSSTPSRRPSRSPRPPRAAQVLCRLSPRARARTGRCRASTAARPTEAVEILTLADRARPRRRPASPSTWAPSSATPRPGLPRSPPSARVFDGAARRGVCAPGCSTSAAASRRTYEDGAPPLPAYGAAIERHLRRLRSAGRPAAHARRARRGIVGDAGTLVLQRDRGASGAATCAGSTSTPASSPGWSRRSTRPSATG